MKRLTTIIANTYVDEHGETMTLSALESIVKSVNAHAIPIGVDHDPRIPPGGRVASARIIKLEDGEFAVEAIFEIFEPGDEIPFAENQKELPGNNFAESELRIIYDRNFRDEPDQVLIREISQLFETEAQEEIKKAVDPLSVLTIGGALFLGNILAGFLNKLGEEGYELLKDRLKRIMGRKKEGEKEKLLKFRLDVHESENMIEVCVILANPNDSDIDKFFEEGLKTLDEILPYYYQPDIGLKRMTFEYDDKNLVLKFGIRKDCVPMYHSSTMNQKDK